MRTIQAKRSATNASRILRLVRRYGILRPRDLAEHGIPRTALQRLVESGAIERRGRGLYIAAGADLGEKQTVIEASRRVPGGIVCLLSALHLHDFTTQTTREVWIALSAKAWRPRNPGLSLRFVFLSGPALESGIQERKIHGVAIRVYNPAKTVADCFKFRNKVGMDVALEALREGWRARLFHMEELTAAAKACRGRPTPAKIEGTLPEGELDATEVRVASIMPFLVMKGMTLHRSPVRSSIGWWVLS